MCSSKCPNQTNSYFFSYFPTSISFPTTTRLSPSSPSPLMVLPLKCAGLLGSHVSDLGPRDSGTKPYCSRIPPERRRTWVCVAEFSGSPADKALRPVEDKSRVEPGAQFSNVPSRLHKDLSNLPKPLSIYTNPSDCSKMRISFKGGPGSYTEEAALKAYPFCQTVACDGFEDVFKAVELWMADKAVLPIENSSCGSIHRNYDLLLRHRLHIVGEVQLPVNLCLLALPGIRAEQLQRVISHPQALTLSDKYLSELGVTRVNVDDTAGAAKFVASENLRDAGVVASVRAAEIYGLNVLAQGIQDVSDNINRFLVLARDPIIPRTDKPFKTSIVCTLEEGPGILFKALAVFALRNINLTKIESRPQRKRPLRVVDDSNTGSAKYFDYIFYIDFEASMAEPRAQYALGHLQEFATFLRILGCYPMDTSL